VFTPLNVTRTDRATGEIIRGDEPVMLPKHVNPMNCPRPLVTFKELVASAKAGDAEALRNLRGHRAKDVAKALGDGFTVMTEGNAPEKIASIVPA
jgi:hypothetical protein